MMVTTEQITAKILDAHHTLGGIDRFYGQTDWAASRPTPWEPASPASPPRSHPPSAPRSDHVR
jgi:hypothetical protein